MTIPLERYRAIADAVPILCVDLVLEVEGKYLLVKRRNEPVKGRWWVPGGRVWKGESIATAAKRKAREELGLSITGITPTGFFEKRFKRNGLSLDGGVHTVSIVVEARPISTCIHLDSQSSAWRWANHLPRDFRIRRFDGDK